MSQPSNLRDMLFVLILVLVSQSVLSMMNLSQSSSYGAYNASKDLNFCLEPCQEVENVACQCAQIDNVHCRPYFRTSIIALRLQFLSEINSFRNDYATAKSIAKKCQTQTEKCVYSKKIGYGKQLSFCIDLSVKEREPFFVNKSIEKWRKSVKEAAILLYPSFEYLGCTVYYFRKTPPEVYFYSCTLVCTLGSSKTYLEEAITSKPCSNCRPPLACNKYFEALCGSIRDVPIAFPIGSQATQSFINSALVFMIASFICFTTINIKID